MRPDAVAADVAQLAAGDAEVRRALFKQDAAGRVVMSGAVERARVLNAHVVDCDLSRAAHQDGESRYVADGDVADRDLASSLDHDAVSAGECEKRTVPRGQSLRLMNPIAPVYGEVVK